MSTLIVRIFTHLKDRQRTCSSSGDTGVGGDHLPSGGRFHKKILILPSWLNLTIHYEKESFGLNQ